MFAGKSMSLGQPIDGMVANLDQFEKQLTRRASSSRRKACSTARPSLPMRFGEKKSKGGESPYAGTSLIDMQENVEGIEAVFKLVFQDPLKKRDAKLAAHRRQDRGHRKAGQGHDLKSLDQPALHMAGEELAVLLQTAAPKLKLKKPALGE